MAGELSDVLHADARLAREHRDKRMAKHVEREVNARRLSYPNDDADERSCLDAVAGKRKPCVPSLDGRRAARAARNDRGEELNARELRVTASVHVVLQDVLQLTIDIGDATLSAAAALAALDHDSLIGNLHIAELKGENLVPTEARVQRHREHRDGAGSLVGRTPLRVSSGGEDTDALIVRERLRKRVGGWRLLEASKRIREPVRVFQVYEERTKGLPIRFCGEGGDRPRAIETAREPLPDH
ncbi:MAG: hypothetical protein ABI779_15930 [Acidobacteriota bacterium]